MCQNNSLRAVRFLLSIPVWWLIFFTIKSALLVSRNPQFFELYSPEKLSFILCSTLFCILFTYFLRKIIIPKDWLSIWEILTQKYLTVFIIISSFFTLAFKSGGIQVGEDLGGQVKSTIQWINGDVRTPNIMQNPSREDLSLDNSEWILRPPGASLLPAFGMIFGLSLGQSIKLSLFLCKVIGGIGWLLLFRRFIINKNYILIATILLGLNCGVSINNYATANIILYALTPWFLILILKFSEKFNDLSLPSVKCFYIALILFCLGCFAWVKLSGLIVAGTIGGSLFFMLIRKYDSQKKFKFAILFGILGIFFWLPFFLLENTNYFLTGITADELYSANDSDIQAPLFGKFWGQSTNGGWLLWSLISAPGYSLPVRDIAHALRDFGMQFNNFILYIHSYSINEHVLLCGLIGIFFSFLIIHELKKCWLRLHSDHKTLMICFFTLPFAGLAILSNRYQWNYLMYHSHTYEYWLIYSIPVMLAYSYSKKLNVRSVVLFAVICALPLGKSTIAFINIFSSKESHTLSSTEEKLGFAPCRFSAAIDVVEKDSKSDLDVLYFLPSGDMGDLIIRTKMRTLATHFAGGNIHNIGQLKTSKPLTLYFAYDASLDTPEFKTSLISKLPQAISNQIIYSKSVIVEKFQISPS